MGLTSGLLTALLVGIIAVIIIVKRISRCKQKDTYNQSNRHPTIPVDENVAYGMVERKGMDLEASYVVN